MNDKHFDLNKNTEPILQLSLVIRGLAVLILSFLLSSCDGDGQNQLKLKSKANHIITKPENGFNCGLLDHNGNLWFGSNGGGVYHYNNHEFVIFSKKNGLCSNQVFAIRVCLKIKKCYLLKRFNKIWQLAHKIQASELFAVFS